MTTRTKVSEFFPTSKHVVLPVIHTEANGFNIEANVEKAMAAGADGVWLICHETDAQWALASHVEWAVNRYQNFWIGVNFLGWDAPRALRIGHEVGARGVWVDDAEIDERVEGYSQPEAHEAHYERVEESLYFGGVAFKYQRKVTDYEKAAQIAKHYMDVVTTSGVATGEAADVDKIRRMRTGLGPEGVLAIASGLTVDNVSDYLPHADILMVATGVSESWNTLDEKKMKAFVDRVRQG